VECNLLYCPTGLSDFERAKRQSLILQPFPLSLTQAEPMENRFARLF
jgi:hypothetical protein